MTKKKTEDNNGPNGAPPKFVLNQLIEHTPGGFVLFYFNMNNGNPEHLVTFDSPICAAALQKYIADFSQALSDINIDNIKYSIASQIEPPDDEKEKVKD